jgi:hypothetical protein
MLAELLHPIGLAGEAIHAQCPWSNRFSGRLCRFGNSYRGGRGAATVAHDKNRYISKIANNLHLDRGGISGSQSRCRWAGQALDRRAMTPPVHERDAQRFVIVAFPAAM